MEYVGESVKEDLALSLVSRIGQEYKINADAYQIDGSSIKVNMGALNVSAGVYLLKVASLNTGKTEIYRLIKY
jgi:hypothetical protein